MFENRKLIIATQHQKDVMMAPLLEKELGVICFKNSLFDTDILGTFSGEIERKENAYLTVKEKCLKAMQLHKTSLGVASEGSFGTHPYGFFQSNEEIVVFIDTENQLEIYASHLSLDTNFNAKTIASFQELKDFAINSQFPSHGLIIRESKEQYDHVSKGIRTWEVLEEKFNELMQKNSSCYIETDMRAMYNPTRMNNIEIATKKLLDKIKSLCPSCQTPGFSIVKSNPGLPCEQCGLPTNSILNYEYKCVKCEFIEIMDHSNEKTHEDPTYCGFCNP